MPGQEAADIFFPGHVEGEIYVPGVGPVVIES